MIRAARWFGIVFDAEEAAEKGDLEEARVLHRPVSGEENGRRAKAWRLLRRAAVRGTRGGSRTPLDAASTGELVVTRKLSDLSELLGRAFSTGWNARLERFDRDWLKIVLTPERRTS